MKPLILVLALSAVSLSGGESVNVMFSPTGNERELTKQLVKTIGAARKQVVVAVFQFTSKDLARALAKAKKRGVDVRVLLEGSQAKNRLVREVLDLLKDVEVKKVWAAGKKTRTTAWDAKFHHKFCVIDGRVVVTGSFNWTVLADEENHENLLFIVNRPVAQKFSERFESIWKNDKLTE